MRGAKQISGANKRPERIATIVDKIQIDALLEKRREFGFPRGEADPWLAEVSVLNKDTFVVIKDTGLETKSAWNRQVVMQIRNNFYIKAIIDLGTPFALPFFADRAHHTFVRLSLFWFTKKKPDSILIGNVTDIRALGRYTAKDIYIDYYTEIENWINTGEGESDAENYHFNVVSADNVEWEYPYPRIHSKNAYKIYKLLQKSDTRELDSMVEIIRPRPLDQNNKSALVLRPRDFKYPLPVKELEKSFPTDTPLQRGDVVLSHNNILYLVNEELDKEVYTTANSIILRPTKIQPEYLYLYLTSDTAKILMESLSRGSAMSFIPRDLLKKLPVILPTEDEEKYRELMLVQNYRVSDLRQIKEAYAEIGEKEDTIEDIINVEWANKIKTFKRSIMQDFLQQDLRELNACFNAKAYKATLILAGSVLEAVLIDWMSEIDKKNYFETPMQVNRDGRWRDASLFDYIDEIKEIKRPSWAVGAERAHVIRKRRNLVHARAVINSQIDINEKSCREVIDYLKYVIETRGLKLR